MYYTTQDRDRDRQYVQFKTTRSSNRYTRDTKFCKWLQQLCPDSGYEVELEEDRVDEDKDGGGGGSIDEFYHVDISKGVDGMHDEDMFEAEEVMDRSNIYE